MRHNLSHATESGPTPYFFDVGSARHSKVCADRVNKDAADGATPKWESMRTVPVEKRHRFMRARLFRR
jgi:hypothetical protein